MSLPLKFPPKYYLIKQNDDVEKKVEYPLSFLTPDGDDAAAEKRKDTGRRWAGGYWYYKQEKKETEEYVIDNVPVEGFMIVNTVSRSTTDNKVFRIFDPRKFQCEISSYNLFDIISRGVIDHGVVQGKYVWARDGQQNYLVSADDKDYLASLLPQEDYTPQIGDHIETQKYDGIIVGQFYISRITTTSIETNERSYGYGYSWKDALTLAYDDKPWFVIDESNGKNSWRNYSWIRKIPKNAVVKQKQKDPNPSIKVDPASLLFFHKTKEEQHAFNPTEREVRTLYYDMYLKPNLDRGYYQAELDRFNKYSYLGKVKKPEAL